MPRYIDKEQAYDRQTLYDWYISSVCDGDPVWTEEHLDELLNDFLLIPKDAPTVDAEPVVRCGQCNRFESCELGRLWLGADGFCSDGERRKENG